MLNRLPIMYMVWIVQHVITIIYMDWINLLFETCLGYNVCDIELLLSKHNVSIVSQSWD